MSDESTQRPRATGRDLRYGVVVVTLLAALAWWGSASAHAEPEASHEEKLGWLAISANPLFYALKGYFVKLSFEPETWNGWTVGITALSMTMSPATADLLRRRDSDLGFGQLSFKPGSAAVQIGRFFGESHSGLHVSLNTNVMRVRAERGSDVAEFTSLFPMARVGYRWLPFRDRTFFLEPAIAMGTELRIAGDKTVGDVPYPTAGFVAAFAVQVGLRI